MENQLHDQNIFWWAEALNMLW